jgi:hypothetical protein
MGGWKGNPEAYYLGRYYCTAGKHYIHPSDSYTNKRGQTYCSRHSQRVRLRPRWIKGGR